MDDGSFGCMLVLARRCMQVGFVVSTTNASMFFLTCATLAHKLQRDELLMMDMLAQQARTSLPLLLEWEACIFHSLACNSSLFVTAEQYTQCIRDLYMHLYDAIPCTREAVEAPSTEQTTNGTGYSLGLRSEPTNELPHAPFPTPPSTLVNRADARCVLC